MAYQSDIVQRVSRGIILAPKGDSVQKFYLPKLEI